MLTGDLRNKIDKLWDAFWTGGLSNPMTVIEQITYLLFIKRLDDIHRSRENKANSMKKPIENPIFNDEQQHLRWSRFKDEGSPEVVFKLVRDEVFPFIKNIGEVESTLRQQMKDATFMIPTDRLLIAVIDMISAIPMQDRDTKGDLYEYLLSKLATAGKNGQFRTPRHIIRMMVEMVAPTPDDTICDPSAGTCGFLVESGNICGSSFPKCCTTKSAKRIL